MTPDLLPIPLCFKDRLDIMLYHIVSFIFAVFPYIVKSKFSDYGTLDTLSEQCRVQGGNFDPQVLMDGSPSKTKNPLTG